MQIKFRDISVVIVLYNTTLEESLTFKSLTNDLQEVSDCKMNLIVYDNSRKSQKINANDFPEWQISYFHDVNNSGVSKAYNLAANLALEKKYKWILLADQDTLFPINSLTKYIESVNKFQSIKLFVPTLLSGNVPYSPCRYYFSRGFIWKNPHPGIHSLKHKNVLNSGMLINLDAFHSVGGYNEKIKLYFSDFDFVLRFEKKFNKFCLINLICHHELSDVVKVEIESAIRRFQHYCEGGFLSASSKTLFIQLFITTLLRSIKLSAKYRNVIFVKIFSKQYLRIGWLEN